MRHKQVFCQNRERINTNADGKTTIEPCIEPAVTQRKSWRFGLRDQNGKLLNGEKTIVNFYIHLCQHCADARDDSDVYCAVCDGKCQLS